MNSKFYPKVLQVFELTELGTCSYIVWYETNILITPLIYQLDVDITFLIIFLPTQ